MKLSSQTDYGLKALLFLAGQPRGKVLTLFEIAKASRLPQSFLAKIFQKLVQHAIVKSFRGATRGYALDRPAKAISVLEVIEAIEGPNLFDRCIFWDNRCANKDPCPLHEGWMSVKPHFVELFQQTTVEDLARGRAWRRPYRFGRKPRRLSRGNGGPHRHRR